MNFRFIDLLEKGIGKNAPTKLLLRSIKITISFNSDLYNYILDARKFEKNVIV